MGRGNSSGLLLMGLSGCSLLYPIQQGDSGADAGVVDASSEVSTEDDTTVICGPNLTCSLSNINVGCCVITNVDSGLPPANYKYECATRDQCAKDQGNDASTTNEIFCDEGSDCTNPNPVCCWPSAAAPTATYCFSTTDTNCAFELCNPADTPPCKNVKHLGFKCVATGSTSILTKAPLGYHFCMPPDAG